MKFTLTCILTFLFVWRSLGKSDPPLCGFRESNDRLVGKHPRPLTPLTGPGLSARCPSCCEVASSHTLSAERIVLKDTVASQTLTLDHPAALQTQAVSHLSFLSVGFAKYTVANGSSVCLLNCMRA